MVLDLDDYELPDSTGQNRENSNKRPLADDEIPELEDLGVDKEPVEVTAPKLRRKLVLDEENLLSDKGLPRIRNMDVKFRKGDEKRYLTKLVGNYQLWAHKLFPKANFENFLEMCERAGNKPSVKRYRLEVVNEDKYKLRDAVFNPSTPEEPPAKFFNSDEPNYDQPEIAAFDAQNAVLNHKLPALEDDRVQDTIEGSSPRELSSQRDLDSQPSEQGSRDEGGSQFRDFNSDNEQPGSEAPNDWSIYDDLGF